MWRLNAADQTCTHLHYGWTPGQRAVVEPRHDPEVVQLPKFDSNLLASGLGQMPHLHQVGQGQVKTPGEAGVSMRLISNRPVCVNDCLSAHESHFWFFLHVSNHMAIHTRPFRKGLFVEVSKREDKTPCSKTSSWPACLLALKMRPQLHQNAACSGPKGAFSVWSLRIRG
jgi:hypothetical protein